MKSTFYTLALVGLLAYLPACNGIINYSSQSSSHSETNISENNETIINGDTTIQNKKRKEKHHSENESKSRIGFSAKDETGIADEIKRTLRDRRKKGDSTDIEDEEPVEKPKKRKTSPDIKGSITCEASISGDEFETTKARFEAVSMDMDRVRKGKVLFSEKCITSKQAQELVSVLGLENYKLEFAKFLYGRTVDKEKFMRVADEFAFEDTKKKLSNYIKD